ncbi:MAG: amidohydrolase family protein [Kiritimatiellae bacterium]|nr:amidohydrolase family protein [Kiritimatiellia bacterium]
MQVDAHHHLWRYTPAEFDWIDDGMAAIRRDFLPDDLRPALTAAGIAATVCVQARQSLEETDWLLEQARANRFIAGVVGWVPLAAPTVSRDLERLTGNGLLKAVRHVVQGEPAGFLRDPAFNRGVALLEKCGLAYDILIYAWQIKEAVEFVDAHPRLTFVLDHIAKPNIRGGELSPWREDIRRLAQRPNVCCKLSGMVTEADFAAWTPDTLRPYFDVVLEAFGPRRLLFGSDWPVCLAACDYAAWADIVRDFIRDLTVAEQQGVMGGNAVRIYKLVQDKSRT